MPDLSYESEAFSSDPDALLMQEAGRGDHAAFESLMRKYYPGVFNFIGRYTGDWVLAEDLSQDIFIKVYQTASGYPPQTKFQTWIYTTARNTTLNALHSLGRTIPLDAGQGARESGVQKRVENPSSQSGREERNGEELVLAVQRAVETLPETQRLAVILRRYENFSYEDIAVVLDMPASAVKTVLSQAKENLRNLLQDFV